MNPLLARVASICLECLQDEIRHMTRSILESYLKQDESSIDCQKCEKKLDAQAPEVPKPE